jgi:uncharacterized protein
MLKPGQDDYFTLCAKQGLPIEKYEIIDAHGHLGSQCMFPLADGSVEGVIAQMDRIGIDRLYASGAPGLFGQAGYGNDIILQAMRKYPEKISGYMIVDIGWPGKIENTLNSCLEAGFCGIKIWSSGNRPGLPYDHPNYRIVFEFAQKHELVILAHTFGSELDQLDSAFKRYDNIKWLLAHSGACRIEHYIRLANEFPNIYLETCLSNCPKGLIERFVQEVPLEKIIWGSDQTFMSATQQIGRVLFAEIPLEAKAAILALNAKRLFKN